MKYYQKIIIKCVFLFLALTATVFLYIRFDTTIKIKNSAIVYLVRNNVPDAIVAQYIEKNELHCDLTPKSLSILHTSGVSEEVIHKMIEIDRCIPSISFLYLVCAIISILFVGFGLKPGLLNYLKALKINFLVAFFVGLFVSILCFFDLKNSLHNDDVLQMLHDKVNSDNIIQFIYGRQADLDLSPESLAKFQHEGADRNVMEAIVDQTRTSCFNIVFGFAFVGFLSGFVITKLMADLEESEESSVEGKPRFENNLSKV